MRSVPENTISKGTYVFDKARRDALKGIVDEDEDYIKAFDGKQPNKTEEDLINWIKNSFGPNGKPKLWIIGWATGCKNPKPFFKYWDLDLIRKMHYIPAETDEVLRQAAMAKSGNIYDIRPRIPIKPSRSPNTNTNQSNDNTNASNENTNTSNTNTNKSNANEIDIDDEDDDDEDDDDLDLSGITLPRRRWVGTNLNTNNNNVGTNTSL